MCIFQRLESVCPAVLISSDQFHQLLIIRQGILDYLIFVAQLMVVDWFEIVNYSESTRYLGNSPVA